MERVEKDRVAQRIYIGVCAGTHSLGRPWIDTVKECLIKRFGCQASKENGTG